jgi:hypothetical protein
MAAAEAALVIEDPFVVGVVVVAGGFWADAAKPLASKATRIRVFSIEWESMIYLAKFVKAMCSRSFSSLYRMRLRAAVFTAIDILTRHPRQ